MATNAQLQRDINARAHSQAYINAGRIPMTAAPREYRDPTPEEIAALEAFAKAHGRNKWRAELTQVYWYNARIWIGPEPGMGSTLHRVRNDLGPTWLYDVYKPAKQA